MFPQKSAAALLAEVWPWAQQQRWCPPGQPTPLALSVSGAHGTLIAQVADRLIQLPLTTATDGVTISSGDGYVLTDGTTSAAFVSAWAAHATPAAAAHLDPHNGRIRDLVKTAPIAPLQTEQSNSSLRRADTIVKFFRCPIVGVNPEVSVSNALWQQGFTNLPAPLASSSLKLADGREITTALATRFLADSRDGFIWATQAQGNISAGCNELGRVTRELHQALALAFPTVPTRIEPAPRLKRQLREVEQFLPASLRAKLAELLERLSEVIFPGRAQRIHGDYHLGQCRYSDTWYILDFEGEPLRSLSEREAPDLPERDIAGMLRSFAYAAAVGKHDSTWQQQAESAFLDGYGNYDRGTLAFFLLEKALYEVKYEAAYRPDWIEIPLAGVTNAAEVLSAWLSRNR